MANGQQIDSGQGSVGLGSHDIPLSGSESTTQTGTLTYDEGWPVTGSEATAAAGSPGNNRNILLRSRKVSGGTASAELSGSLLSLLQQPIPSFSLSALLAGGSIAASQGVFSHTRTRAVSGIAASSSHGSLGASGGSNPSDDWGVRSTAAGVIQAIAFNTAAEVATYGNAASNGDSSGRDAEFDSTTPAPDGFAGTARTRVLNTDGPASGTLRIQFPQSFGPGTTFWTSFRVRMPPQFAYQPWPFSGSGGNHKLSITSSFAASNTPFECVIQGQGRDGQFSGYHQDGVSTSVFEDLSFSSPCNGGDVRDQPAIDRGANPLTGNNPDTGDAWTTTCVTGRGAEQTRARYSSLYSSYSTPGVDDFRRGYGDPLSRGVRYWPDEWLTVTQRKTIGTPGSFNSRRTCWVARDGQPYELLFDSQNIKLGGTATFDAQWLLGYVSDRIAGGRKISGRTNNITGTTFLVCGLGTPIGDGTIEYDASNQRLRWAGIGETFGVARGFSEANGKLTLNVISSGNSYLVVKVDPASLPTSGIVTDRVTIADGRPDTQLNYCQHILSAQAINAPGGYAPDPSWYLDANENEWLALTGGPADTLLDVNPCGAGILGCSYSGNQGLPSVTDVWCGGAASSNSLLICAQGGHAAYAGNEAYEYVFNVEQPRFHRRVNPSTSVQERVGYYADGKPSSRHGYNHDCYIPTLSGSSRGDRWYAPVAEAVYYVTGGAGQSWNKGASYSRVNGTYDPEGFWANFPGSTSFSGSCVYDSVTEKVWFREGWPTAWNLRSLDVRTNVWANHGSGGSGFSELHSAMVDPVRRVMVQCRANEIFVTDLANPSDVGRRYTVSGLTATAAPGIKLEPTSGNWVHWDGGKTLRLITPPSNYRTGDGSPSNALNASAVYAVGSTLTPSGGATPTSPSAQGTYGRFNYIANPKGFCVVNRYNEPMYFFKIPAGGL